MGHALTEAHRVLEAGGLVVDLCPGAVHRRVHAVEGEGLRLLGVMRERFDEERAARRALGKAVRAGLFALRARTAFPCNRLVASYDDFRSWLEPYAALLNLAPHTWLLRRVQRAFAEGDARRARVVIQAPVDLTVLERLP